MMIAAESVVVKKTLKIKFPSQPREAASGMGLCGQQSSFVRTWATCSSVGENSHPRMDKQLTILPVAKKRGAPGTIQCQLKKRRKMDRSVTQQCSALVKALIRHPLGWVFKDPVDPLKLSIPDYFLVIKKPMDFGTIKAKLDKNQYVSAEEFAADVRLTFSNAMLYNPPSNSVHHMAEELNGVFEMEWRSLEGKWNCDRLKPKPGSGKFSSVSKKEISDKEQISPKTPLHQSVVLPKKLKPAEKKVLGNPLSSMPADVKLVRIAENCVDKSSGSSLKGADSGDKQTCSSVEESSLIAIAAKCGACGMLACQCNLHSNSTQTSSDISYERPLDRDHLVCRTDASKVVFPAKVTKASQLCKSDPDSDGAVSALDEESMCPSSELTTATDATSGEGCVTPPFDIQLSPTKALRAAILKQRFADTILKAQHKTLHEHGDKADPVKMRLEKERLEKRQREEKARIEAQIRAAEAASRKREEMELRKQRERQREAARVALLNMEKTVDMDQNLEILKELELLSGGSLSYNVHFSSARAKAVGGENEAHFGSPLEQLGLFIRDEAEDEDEEVVNGDGEEGEILY